MKKTIPAILCTMTLLLLSAVGLAEQSAAIGEDAARAAALSLVQMTEEEAQSLRIRLERDDGRLLYDIEFSDAEGRQFDVEIDAQTGTMIACDMEAERAVKAAPARETALSESEARALALSQIPEASDSDLLKWKADKGHDRVVYEGEIRHDGLRHEFEIDAVSGLILEWETRIDP